MVTLSAADVATLKLLSAALLAVTVQVPNVVAVTRPVEVFTLQMASVLVANVTVPVPLPPIVVSVDVPPRARFDGLLTTISAA